MESQPLGYPGRPGVSRHGAGLLAHDGDDPFLIVREGNGGAGTGVQAHRIHTPVALRMNRPFLGLQSPRSLMLSWFIVMQTFLFFNSWRIFAGSTNV